MEYSAASDAYTHCPERFDEFFNQRRRWVPSTMANILDLLADSKRTVKVNDNISTLYIMYQVWFLFKVLLLFRLKQACVQLALSLNLHKLHKNARESKLDGIGIFSDLSIAFDCVTHDTLLMKLRYY